MAKLAVITCRTLQEEWCPARHQDEAASAAVLAKCLSARMETEVENAVEVEVIRVVRFAQTLLLLLDRAHSQTRV